MSGCSQKSVRPGAWRCGRVFGARSDPFHSVPSASIRFPKKLQLSLLLNMIVAGGAPRRRASKILDDAALSQTIRLCQSVRFYPCSKPLWPALARGSRAPRGAAAFGHTDANGGTDTNRALRTTKRWSVLRLEPSLEASPSLHDARYSRGNRAVPTDRTCAPSRSCATQSRSRTPSTLIV